MLKWYDKEDLRNTDDIQHNNNAEEFAKHKGNNTIYTRFSADYVESQRFYLSMGFKEIASYEMVKYL